MTKKHELICYCGTRLPITEADLGFEELECPHCETMNQVPESFDLLEQWNKETTQENQTRNQATHVRIMLKGEDGIESCLHNLVPKNEFLDLIITGYKVQYPEGYIWTEDEEATNPNYMAELMREIRH